MENAKKLLEKWEQGATSEEGQIIRLLRVWLGYSEDAAEKITEDKTPAKCFGFMRQKATKAKKGGVGDEEAMEWILEFYGAENPKLIVEGGLAYAALMDAAKRFKPYEPKAPAPADSLDALLEW